MPQTNFTTDILPQESRTELSGAEFLKKLQKKRKQVKKIGIEMYLQFVPMMIFL